MKSVRKMLKVVVAMSLLGSAVQAGNFDVEIHCVPKKVDQNVRKASDGGANTTKEHWVHDVTIENKTFKELADLEVKYVIFFKH